MKSNNWEDFYRSGKVSDYLKYINSAKNASGNYGEYTNADNLSGSMESVQYAEKSDGDGAIRHTGW